MSDNMPLVDALIAREEVFMHAIDRLREIASPETENEVYELTSRLGQAVELTRCLRRLVSAATVREIHDAFGAPGDFGYGAPLGDALYQIYSGSNA